MINPASRGELPATTAESEVAGAAVVAAKRETKKVLFFAFIDWLTFIYTNFRTSLNPRVQFTRGTCYNKKLQTNMTYIHEGTRYIRVRLQSYNCGFFLPISPWHQVTPFTGVKCNTFNTKYI